MYVSRVGLDPEVAIINKETGMGRSAHKFMGDEKIELSFHTDSDKEKRDGVKGAEVERDGAAIEVRSTIASACRDNIIPYLAEGLRQAQLLVEQRGNNEFTLSSSAKYVLDDESFEGDYPIDIEEFGCRPDVDAYELSEKDPVCEPGDDRRWTGGHLHMSAIADGASIHDVAAWAILYDYLVAAPMVSILGEKFSEGEAERRELYGQPGSFRYDANLKKVEFRTLSGRVLLHPTILFWAVGAMKMMALQTDKPIELVQKLNQTIPTDFVYDTVLNHRVDQAEEITNKVYGLLPKYEANQSVLANPIGGGGGGTYNPYFFEMAAKVFMEGNKQGVTFPDDMKWNWGLYEDYEPKHHAYWGIQAAMVGACDEAIFPQNAILDRIWPKEYIQSKPVYTHPTNGGQKTYTTPGAASWLA
jgi:hypothetical protein